ncbi:MAG: globin [Mycobacterium sp.]|jgi:hemoglobin|nr:globin [Mycobacterium sp.]
MLSIPLRRAVTITAILGAPRRGERASLNAFMTEQTSLYQRLGGYDVIAAVIDDLFAALRSDPAFARFASGRSIDSHNRARQLLVDQMCELSGGPCIYIGRDMKTSHSGLGITESEWDANMRYAAEALAGNGIGEAEQTGFLALFERYRRDVVEG